MKRFLLIGLLLCFHIAWGQNVKIVGEICPGCAVYVEGRHLQPSDHKAGCWWLAQQQQQSQSSSEDSGSPWGQEPYSDSGTFESVEGKPLTNDEYYELLIRTHCDYCGAEFSNQHKSDCIIGKTYNMWQRTMRSGKEWDATRLRDNVVTLMLGTDSGKKKLHAMRGESTKLKDYTPEPEKPADKPTVSENAPLLSCPLAQPAPQFSGINEQSIVYETVQTTAGVHEWGEMADEEQYRKYPIEYDIERRTHMEGGPVILGKRNQDGSVKWIILHRDMQGKYVRSFPYDPAKTPSGKEVSLKDVRFEGEGRFMVLEYADGLKIYKYAATDGWITKGYNVGVAPMMVNGRCFLLEKEDNGKQILHAGPRNMLIGDEIVLFNDAIIERNSYGCRLLNWDWKALNLDGEKSFKDVQCFNSDRGSYYVIKMDEGKFALVGRGFRRVGGIYSSADEALLAWSKQ